MRRSTIPLVSIIMGTVLAVPFVQAKASEVEGESRRGDGVMRAEAVKLQDTFDSVGAEVHSLTTSSGREVFYIDEGHEGWRPIVYISGQGTSLQSFQLTEFARRSREELNLRVISVERNGFGDSSYDSSLDYDEYVNEILAVLDRLDIERFVIQAVSGGGAYAAHLAARVPDRVMSLHLSSVISWTLPNRNGMPNQCSQSREELAESLTNYTHNPKAWWGQPSESPVHRVPGWQNEAYLDAARTFFIDGKLGSPDALTHEYLLPCNPSAVVRESALTNVQAPTYLYWGADDTVVSMEHMERWSRVLPNVVKERVYPGEGHTVQYRHWDQILVDMAGFGEYTVICSRGDTQLVDQRKAERELRGGATLGICAWTESGETRVSGE